MSLLVVYLSLHRVYAVTFILDLARYTGKFNKTIVSQSRIFLALKIWKIHAKRLSTDVEYEVIWDSSSFPLNHKIIQLGDAEQHSNNMT